MQNIDKKGIDFSKVDKSLFENVTKKVTLNLFRCGTDQTNYHILEMLPCNIKEIMKDTNLTKMPANRRINELEKVGLLMRNRYEGKINPTKLTEIFLRTFQSMQQDILKELPNLL
ncbi:hypothetical protein HZB02_07525 [Candidatus Woesearchaeota archaeon]|nr:hypothetical protein [Candidatus Woesearchaeota archaeon]